MAEVIVKSLTSQQAGSIAIPTGCYIREIIQLEQAGFKVNGGIKYGTFEGGDDIVASFTLDASEHARIAMDRYRTPSDVFFDAVEDWNGAQVDIILVLGDLGS